MKLAEITSWMNGKISVNGLKDYLMQNSLQEKKRMYKEISRLVELLKLPQSRILELDKVAHLNGDDLTLTIATEECAELIQAITKVKRYGFNGLYQSNLHEEVADVLICIAELVSLGYLDIDEVIDWQRFKIDREVSRHLERWDDQYEL